MALIPISGILPRKPWDKNSGPVLSRDLHKIDDYGAVDISDPIGWLYLLAGKNAKKTKDGWVYENGKEVPTPPKLGGKPGNTYIAGDGASMHNYNSIMKKYKSLTFDKLLRDVLKKYNVVFESEEDMIDKYGSVGFEYKNDKEDVIKMAYNIPVEKKIDVLAHEAAAKELLGENRTEGDHDAIHPEIIEHAEKIKETYLRKAIEMLRN
jgi:hypothetical protein